MKKEKIIGTIIITISIILYFIFFLFEEKIGNPFSIMLLLLFMFFIGFSILVKNKILCRVLIVLFFCFLIFFLIFMPPYIIVPPIISTYKYQACDVAIRIGCYNATPLTIALSYKNYTNLEAFCIGEYTSITWGSAGGATWVANGTDAKKCLDIACGMACH